MIRRSRCIARSWMLGQPGLPTECRFEAPTYLLPLHLFIGRKARCHLRARSVNKSADESASAIAGVGDAIPLDDPHRRRRPRMASTFGARSRECRSYRTPAADPPLERGRHRFGHILPGCRATPRTTASDTGGFADCPASSKTQTSIANFVGQLARPAPSRLAYSTHSSPRHQDVTGPPMKCRRSRHRARSDSTPRGANCPVSGRVFARGAKRRPAGRAPAAGTP